MREKISYYNRLSFLALVVFLVLVSLQVIWLYRAAHVQREEMELKLEQLAPAIAMEINEISHRAFHGDSLFLEGIELEEVSAIVKSHLDSNDITAQTHFALYNDRREAVFMTDAPALRTELLAADTKTCLSCIVSFSVGRRLDQEPGESSEAYTERLFNQSSFQYYAPVAKINKDGKDVIWLSLYQPDLLSSAIRSLTGLFVASVGLLLFLFWLIAYLLRQLSKHKNLTMVKEDFFNNMTHEFKTPLSSIRLASVVLQKNRDPEKSKIYHELIEKESKNLELQIDKLLELSLLDNKELRLEKEAIDIHEIIKETVSGLRPLLDQQSARLLLDLQMKTSVFSVDKDHFSNSIKNLIENSIKFAEGPITIWVNTSDEQGNRKIIVRDNGVGIKSEYQPYIFDRFYRAKKENEYKSNGFGIGLSYVKGVVEAHGGNIELNTAYKAGCEFIIKF